MANGYFDWDPSAPLPNGTADPNINWAEGQAPSTVNNSARAMMQRLAQRLADEGYPLATGTANALVLTPLNTLTSYATGMTFTATAASNNSAASTLNISGVGAKSIRVIAGGTDVALSGGELLAGRKYDFEYDAAANSAAGGFILINPSNFTSLSVTSSSPGPIATLTSTDSGASAGPGVDLYRDSVSPAVNDVIGQWRFRGRNSVGTSRSYLTVEGSIIDPVDATEDAQLQFYAYVAGTQTNIMNVGPNLDLGTVGQIKWPTSIVTSSDLNTIYAYARGTYTPTLTNSANIASSAAYLCTWQRFSNIVTVFGKVDVDPTTTATSTTLDISLPVASNLANDFELIGQATAISVAGEAAAIFANTTSDVARMQWVTNTALNHAMYFNFSYRII